MYNTSADVLAVLLARASGKPLEVLLRERLFGALGMNDTSFSVPASKRDRFATSYIARNPGVPDGSGLDLYDGVEDSQWAKPPAFPSGGGGLVSTADDYLSFGKMLLSRGKLGGEQILSEASVDAMTSDQLTAAQKAASPFAPGFWNSHGWGFGLLVLTGADEVSRWPGRFGWDGGLGTSWCSDPTQEIVAILLTQRAAFPGAAAVHRDFWKLVYDGIDA
jgi:CubicO group peptidase (beta-lactamase class C family)